MGRPRHYIRERSVRERGLKNEIQERADVVGIYFHADAARVVARIVKIRPGRHNEPELRRDVSKAFDLRGAVRRVEDFEADESRRGQLFNQRFIL